MSRPLTSSSCADSLVVGCAEVIEECSELAAQGFGQPLCDFLVVEVANVGNIGGDSVE